MMKKTTRQKKAKFTWDDDAKLRKLVKKHGEGEWKFISEKMKKFTPRECKERFDQVLIHRTYKTKWTLEEDMKVKQLVKDYGTRWSIISKFFTTRSVNDLKNRFYRFILLEKDEGALANSKVQLTENVEEKNDCELEKNQQSPKDNFDNLFESFDLFYDDDLIFILGE